MFICDARYLGKGNLKNYKERGKFREQNNTTLKWERWYQFSRTIQVCIYFTSRLSFTPPL